MVEYKTKKVSDFIREIPSSEKEGMNVPARVYASEKLFKEMDDGVFEQLTNVACMPGIKRYALAMSDAHWGYGSPVGGVAAFDLKEGVISPGIIGFDVNCLAGNTKVLTIDGEILIKKFEKKNTKVGNVCDKEIHFTFPQAFMKFKKKIAYKVETELGNTVIATDDHPFLTKTGMRELKNLEIGSEVTIFDKKIMIDKINKIKKVFFDDFVYDFTIPITHNFIANNFILSNCGMRLIRTNLTEKQVRPKIKEIVNILFEKVPVGVGRKGTVKLNRNSFFDLMNEGVNWCEQNGFAWKDDSKAIEEHGCIKGALTEKVSKKAIDRGIDQLGTLGSGNHYLEIQVVPKNGISDEKTAKALGLFEGQVVIMVHCGSRGFGHQVATDYLGIFEKAMQKYGISVKDKQLACGPFESQEGKDYYAAMVCAANSAFCNRQLITHRVRESFEKVFKVDSQNMEMDIVYDVAHNIAKIERHFTGEKHEKVIVHRKGATRSFEPGHEELWGVYSKVGQPVIVGGSMETGSYLCVGTKRAMDETFGSTLHGSGRTMSRTAAKKLVDGKKLQEKMEKSGIFVKSASFSGLAEEAGSAYKDINDVIETMHLAGISLKVAALKPIGNIKG